jgi:hypothetical protein
MAAQYAKTNEEGEYGIAILFGASRNDTIASIAAI